MFENRISEFFADPVLAPVGVPCEECHGFVACPAPLFATFTAAQSAFVAEVYRRAQELTEAQLRKPTRRRLPDFSRN